MVDRRKDDDWSARRPDDRDLARTEPRLVEPARVSTFSRKPRTARENA
jgi:hypothetical protein